MARHLPGSSGLTDEVVREAVDTHITKYHAAVAAEARNIRKRMLDATRNLTNEYHRFLLLPAEFQHLEKLEKEKKEKAHIRKESDYQYNFILNTAIDELTTLPKLQKQAIENKLTWQGELTELRKWYQDILQTDTFISEYQQKKSPSAEDHLNALAYFFKKIIFKHETCDAFWADRDPGWLENGPILKSMVMKTLQDYDPDATEPFELKELSLNPEDDFEFFEAIFDQAIRQNDYFEKLIADKTKNWDVNRLAMTDRIILKLALAEMIHCISIPVKVSINEYIELSKLYSTPKSKQFVNGILDVLANQLTSEGVIKKSGRGLIDNR
jgi:N utilization substance protein B